MGATSIHLRLGEEIARYDFSRLERVDGDVGQRLQALGS
jgi:hypothetical protein